MIKSQMYWFFLAHSVHCMCVMW